MIIQTQPLVDIFNISYYLISDLLIKFLIAEKIGWFTKI